MKEERCYGCMRMKEIGGICPHCGAESSVQNEDHQLLAGTILKEQYLIGKVLGQGGFGITYIGWDRYLEIPVAIKEYFPSGVVSRNCKTSTDVVSGSGEIGARFRNSRERFMREVKMLARLSDIPEIVQVKTFFLENNTAYIVMEYIEGITLKEYVEKMGGRLDYQKTLNLLGPVIKALEKVHRAGIVHRDISPDNIMIQKDGKVKLLDFGAVRDVGLVLPDKPLSQSTEAILKQGYAPVEQYQTKGSLGPWTDVYAMCATMYFCLMGKVPTDAPGRMLGDEMKWFDDAGIELPEEVSRTLEKGMELGAQDRIKSMDELYRGLFGKAPAPDPNLDPNPVPNIRSRIWKTAIVGILVIAFGAGAWGIVQSRNTDGQVIQETETAPAPVPETEIETAPAPAPETETETTPAPSPEPVILSGECGENLSYELNCDTGVLTLTAGEAGEGIMTDFLDDKDHTGEPRCPWEDQRELIRKVVITENVTTIGKNAFDHCQYLTRVEGLENLTEIHTRAFRGCTNLSEIELSDGLTVIGECAFENTGLKEITVPSTVEEIGTGAFYHTSLEKITFEGDPALGEQSEYEDVEPNNLFEVNGEIPENLRIYGLTGSAVETLAYGYRIPFVSNGYVEGYKLSGQCGDNVFWELRFDTDTLTLTGTGPTWFYRGSMEPQEDDGLLNGWPDWHGYSKHVKKLVIGPEIKELGSSLFEDCLALEEVELRNVERINTHVFSNTGLTSIVFPDSIKFFGNYACDGNRMLEEIFIPEGIEEVCSGVFTGCESLKKVTILGSPYMESEIREEGMVTAFLAPWDEIIPDLVLYGYEDSSIKTYASENGIPFVAIERETEE